MTLVSRLITRRGDESCHGVALVAGADGRQMTWGDLAGHARQWSSLVAERRLTPRSRVGLVVDDPLTFSAAYLGCLSAGLAAVPLDPRGSGDELAGAVSRLRVDVLLTDRGDILEAASEIELWGIASRGPSIVSSAPIGPRPADGVPLRPAALLASSGTTGDPKGIPLSEYQLLHAARRIARHHLIGPDDRGYTPLPLFHVNAQVVGLLTTLVSGSSLVVDRRFVGAEYWDRVAHWRPTWLNTVPAVLAALLDQGPPPQSVSDGVRFARSASAPLPLSVLRRFEDHTGIGVLETYGMTEAASQVTANPVDRSQRHPGSVGRAVGIGLAIVSENGRAAQSGEVGEVRLTGSPVVSHYIRLSETGPETLWPARDEWGWLSTGDLGLRDADGLVHLVGRTDDVVNRGGEKLYPREVEEVLLTHPDVVSVAVVPAPHPKLGQVPVAFVTARPQRPDQSIRDTGTPDIGASDGPPPHPLADQLHQLCRTRLTRYKWPTEIHVAASLPTGPIGKILRRHLRAAVAVAETST